ncbi:MAG: N-acetyltransferase [Flavobacteriales bacterium TMED96]|nr:MAG: N-acetyltransferase [Flavobacteriales bacterium TMED96]
MIEIIEVTKKSELKAFVDFQFKLYERSPFWVPPIKNEELFFLNKETNPAFKTSDVSLFLAYRGKKIVGRVAAIVNWIEVNKLKKNKVRFGWFDVVDDFEVSKVLIEKVKEFGKSRKMDFIEGPVGFSNMDKAGMLVMGYDKMNTIITNYNYSYYPAHMEKLKMKKLAQWIEFEIKIPDFKNSPEKVRKFGKLIIKKYNLKVLHFKKNIEIEPYVNEMFQLIEKTYSNLQTFVPIQKYQINYYQEKYLKYAHPEYIKCVSDQSNKLIGFVIIMPSFTKALKRANGKLLPFGIFHLLKAKYFNNRASFYLIGVDPEYQNKGVIAILINEIQKLFNKKGITEVETNPELEENTSIHQLWKNYKHNVHKKRATFSIKI